MKWLSNLFAKLFKKKSKTDWEALNYGKPSTKGDEFRENNNA